jgi:VanZ family protein
MNFGIKINEYRRLIFWTSLVLVLVLSLMPSVPHMPTTGWDKTNHLLTFAFLAFLGHTAYPGRNAAILLGLLLYGGLIEILQSFTPSHFSEWADWIADGLGLVIGWGLEGAFHKSGRPNPSD